MKRRNFTARFGLLLGLLIAAPAWAPPIWAADVELAADSTLEGILSRGKLRVGFEAGYMPFEMVDKRGGLRERNLRAGDVRKGGQQASFIGFDIDIAREMAKALGVKFVPVNGAADAFVYDLPFNAVFVAMHGDADLVFLDEPFTTEPIAWAVRRNDPDFLNWLNKFLADIKADGRFGKIYEKWFGSTDWFRYVE